MKKTKPLRLCQVALQFPDSLLPNSVSISRALRAEVPDANFYILADTSYNRYSCNYRLRELAEYLQHWLKDESSISNVPVEYT